VEELTSAYLILNANAVWPPSMIEQMEFGNFGFGFFAFSSPDDITYPDGQSYPGLPSACVFVWGETFINLIKRCFSTFYFISLLGAFLFSL